MFEAMTGLSEITAVILAGGLGRRLRPAVMDRPKVLAQVLGRPFLTFLLNQLAYAGIRRAVLCTGYMSESVHQALGDTHSSLKLIYTREEKPLGTGGALRLALPELASDIVLIMNGDSYLELDLPGLLAWFSEKAAVAAMALTRVSDTGRYGRVLLAEDGRIEVFEEKGDPDGPGWVNGGIYFLRKACIAAIPAGQTYSLEREFFPKLIGKGLYGYPSEGPFIDIGTPDSYGKAEAFFRDVQKKDLSPQWARIL